MKTIRFVYRPFGSTLSVVLFLAILIGLSIWQADIAAANNEDLIWKGIVEAAPADGQIGDWTIGGQDFVADADTEFDESEGDLDVGVCAKVRYTVDQGIKLAQEIDSQPASDCDNGGDNGGSDGDLEWRGIVDAAPADNARIGEWTVRERVFVADANTKFDESEGAVEVGACVKVDYSVNDDGSYLAAKIDSESAADCSKDDGGNGGEDQKVYARVDAMPDGSLIGEWTIGGVVYAADANTYFEQEHGALAVGICVKVEYVNGNPPLAKEIKTESNYKCDGQGSDDDDNDDSVNYPKGELYGVIRSLPEGGLIGEWMVGSIAISVTEQTKLHDEKGPFEVGVLIKVKFYTNANDENIALKITSKYKTDDDGNDDDDNGSHEGKEGHAYGIIEAMPAGTSGSIYGFWTISGIDYIVNDTTELDDDDTLAVGMRVKVKYYVNADGKRVAKEIEATDDDGGPSDPGHYKTYGFVEQTPVNGLIGQWVIDGVSFVADQNTIFDDSRGVVVGGSYVEVEYYVIDGVNRLKKVEAHVPPGAGDDDKQGQLESIGQLAASGADANSATWIVDGVSFTVTDATALNNGRGTLSVGSIVNVNSYVDGTGARVATLVSGVVANTTVYLPRVAR